MTNIALTGSSGHLGFIIHKMLERDNVPHRLLLRNTFDHIEHSDIVIGSLEDADRRKEFLTGCTAVIHCAGLVWPKTGANSKIVHVNYELTRQLYFDALNAGVRQFVFISSIHSMEVPSGKIFDEGAELVVSNRNSYDFSKAEAERFLNERKAANDNIEITILNPTAIIGPGDHYIRGLNQLFDRLIRGRLPAVTAGGFDVVDVRDVASGAIAAVLNNISGKYLLSGKYYRITELAEIFGRVCNIKVTGRVISPRIMKLLAFVSSPIDRLASKPLPLNTYSVHTLLKGHPGISSSAAVRDLSYENTAMEDTMKDLHLWLTRAELNL